MKLLETKEQLTLNELLRIAYEYGNDNADMPTDSENVDKEFSEWVESNEHLFKKLIIPHVSKRSELFCVKGYEFDKCDRFKYHINGCNFCDIKAK